MDSLSGLIMDFVICYNNTLRYSSRISIIAVNSMAAANYFKSFNFNIIWAIESESLKTSAWLNNYRISRIWLESDQIA